MQDFIREWWSVVVLVLGGGGLGGAATWFITQRTAWFRSNTVKAEEEAKQERARAQAFAAATIDAIKAGDASAYGTMLEWMKGQLLEQSENHAVSRDQMQGEMTTLRARADAGDRRISALIETVSDCEARDTAARRELGELRVNMTQALIMKDREREVVTRQNVELIAQNRKLIVENLHLRGLADVTATGLFGPTPEPYARRSDDA